MTDTNQRFVRWQGQAMSQLSVVLALLSGLALGGLALSFTLLQQSSFQPKGWYAACFLGALLSLFVTGVTSAAATFTRLLDFRLTARKVRLGDVDEPLTHFGTDASSYGRATWRLLWVASISLAVAIALLTVSLANAYLGRLIYSAWV